MRILQVVTARQFRGAEVFAIQLSDRLAGRGHDVRVVGLLGAPDGGPTPRLATYEDLGAPGTAGLRPAHVAGLRGIIRGFAPDIVQANGSATLKYSVAATRLMRRAPVLVYRNISIASHWLRFPGQRYLMRQLVKRLEHVVAVSHKGAADFSGTYGTPPERLTVIPRGTECSPPLPRADARRSLRRLIGASAQDRVLVHVGNFSPEKNHLWLIRALSDLLRRRGDTHMVLIGNGVLFEACREAIRCAPGGRRMHMLGDRSDVSTLLAGGDVLLLPSLIEGTPGVVLEAGAQGVPAIATNVGGVPEVLEHGVTGLMCESGDQTAFVAAVERLLEQDAYRSALGGAARELVVSRFDLDAVVGRFETLYRSLAAPDIRVAAAAERSVHITAGAAQS